MVNSTNERANYRVYRWLAAVLVLSMFFGTFVTWTASDSTLKGGKAHAARIFKAYQQEIEVQPAVTNPGAAKVSVIRPSGGISYTVSGRVIRTDASGSVITPVVGITVTFGNLTTTTNVNGLYSFSQVFPGQYTLHVTVPDHCEKADDIAITVSNSNYSVPDLRIVRKTDQFGYVCVQESSSYIPATNRIEAIASNGAVATISLPFAFNYYGASYSSLEVQSGGIVGFQPGSLVGLIGPGSPIPSPANPRNSISTWFSQILLPSPIGAAGVFTNFIQDGNGSRFVIRWAGHYLDPATTTATLDCELVLWRKGAAQPYSYDIYMNYQTTGNQTPDPEDDYSIGQKASVGLEGPAANNTVDGFQYSYREGVLFTGLSIHYSVPPQGTVTGVLRRFFAPSSPLTGVVRARGTSRTFSTRVDYTPPLTGYNGVYTLTLPPGTYTLEGNASRYISDTTTVSVVAGQTTQGADILLKSARGVYQQAAYNNMWVTYGLTSTAFSMNIANGGTGNLRWFLREATNPPPLPLALPDHMGDDVIPIDPATCLTNGYPSLRYSRQVPRTDGQPGTLEASAVDWTLNPHNVLTAPLRVLLYSDHNQPPDLYYYNNANPPPVPAIYYNPSARGLCYLSRIAGEPPFQISGYFNEPAGFWNALNNAANTWDVVLVEHDQNLRFQDYPLNGLPTGTYAPHWQILRDYLNGSGVFNGREGGKLVMSTFDVTGRQPGPGNPVYTETAQFFNATFGIQGRNPREVNPRSQYIWEPNNQLFSRPFVLTDVTNQNLLGYNTGYGSPMTVDEVIAQPLVGYSRNATEGEASLIATLDQKAVLASNRLVLNRQGINSIPPDPQAAKWYANMLKYVEAPPINYTDLPWISESPISGTTNITSPTRVQFTLDARNLSARTVLTGFLYSANNDPLVDLRLGGKVIPLRVEVIAPGDNTPTPSAPPIVDLGLYKVEARATVPNFSNLPQLNQPSIVTATIKNFGAIQFEGSASVRLYFNQVTTPTQVTACSNPNDCFAAQTSNLPGGQTLAIGTTHTFTQGGKQTVWVVIDAPGDENPVNDIGSGTVCVATRTTPSFSDVPATNIFVSYIEFLYCNGIVGGFPNTPPTTIRFEPNSNTTRGQFAKIAKLGFGIPSYVPAAPTFRDVAVSNVFYGYVEAVAHVGAVNGLTAAQCTGLGTTAPCYGPNVNITRGQVAAIVQRVRRYAVYSPTSPTFSDVAANNLFYNAIETLAHGGIISGNYCAGTSGPFCFRPNDNIKRGELSKVVKRSIDLIP